MAEYAVADVVMAAATFFVIFEDEEQEVHVSSACLKIRNTNQSLLPILRPPPSMHRPFWQPLYAFLVLSYKIGRFFTPSINFSTSITTNNQPVKLCNLSIYQ